MSQPPYFTGPLGLWPFPIINLVLSLVYSMRMSYMAAYLISKQPTQAQTEKPFENEEYYKIVRDEKGEIVGIEIHRKVVPVVEST